MRTAQRRYDDKILKRRLKQPKHSWILRDDRLSDRERKRWLGSVRTTGTVCSCLGCRNSRRHYGPSMQEKRQIAWMDI